MVNTTTINFNRLHIDVDPRKYSRLALMSDLDAKQMECNLNSCQIIG
jgi:hypothetical protein